MLETIDYIDIFIKKSYYENDIYVGEISFFQPDTSISFDDLIDLSACSQEMYYTVMNHKSGMSPKDLYIDWIYVNKKGLGSVILDSLVNEIKPKRIFFIVPDVNLSVKEFYKKVLVDYVIKKDFKQYMLFLKK